MTMDSLSILSHLPTALIGRLIEKPLLNTLSGKPSGKFRKILCLPVIPQCPLVPTILTNPSFSNNEADGKPFGILNGLPLFVEEQWYQPSPPSEPVTGGCPHGLLEYRESPVGQHSRHHHS